MSVRFATILSLMIGVLTGCQKNDGYRSPYDGKVIQPGLQYYVPESGDSSTQSVSSTSQTSLQYNLEFKSQDQKETLSRFVRMTFTTDEQRYRMYVGDELELSCKLIRSQDMPMVDLNGQKHRVYYCQRGTSRLNDEISYEVLYLQPVSGAGGTVQLTVLSGKDTKKVFTATVGGASL